MSASVQSPRRVDVVILTAITLEYQAALEVEAGALPGSHWERQQGPNGLPVAFRVVRSKSGRPLRVAVAQAAGMGGVEAVKALLPLVTAYRPKCVAMCGVCAGRPGKTNLGDVIAPDRLFFHDTGKRLPDKVQQDLKTYNLRNDWKVALEHFDFRGRFRNEEWWRRRPIPYEWQENWLLAKLHQGVSDPASLPECDVFCPKWEKVTGSLWKSGHLVDGTLSLTDAGRQRIGRVLTQNRNRLPDLSGEGSLFPFNVHVAPMGSGNQVIEDEAIWPFISESMRTTLGLEMEASAIGALAEAQRDMRLDALVMKGVMDFANPGRDDHFKEFAARASAECLLAFLREHLEGEVVADIDDLLVPGSDAALPKDPPASALLHARYEVVPFHGREGVLAELDRWSDEGPSVAVRLVHAEGGVGKTRLAIEWLRRRREQHWAAGFLPKEVPEDWFTRLTQLGQPVVVTLDYAESRADLSKTLLRALRYAQQEGTRALQRIRLLLLARNDGDWWQALRQTDPALDAWLGSTPPLELAPLAPNELEREQVFHEAVRRFAAQRGRKYAGQATASFADARFERVLYLHMAALAAVEGLEFQANTLMDTILDHEERFWELRARQDDISGSMQRSVARQMVAGATLRGGFADFESAVRVMGRVLGQSLSEEEKKVLWLLHRIYQRADTGSGAFLPPLEPDLLGEGLVLRVAAPKPKRGEVPPPSNWIERMFPADEAEAFVSTGLEVLGRASVTAPELARPWIDRLLAEPLHARAKLALEAAKAIGLRTAFSALGDALADRLEAGGDAQLAHALEAAGIPYPTVSLLRVSAWTSRTLSNALAGEKGVEAMAARAVFLDKLGTRLGGLGKLEEAMRVSAEAVATYRELIQHDPQLLHSLACSLNNLSTRLSNLGRREQALDASAEAVKLYRELAQRDPDAFNPMLAGSIINLGNYLSELGRLEEALRASGEAVELLRTLERHHPRRFQADLALSLNNLGARLGDLGRWKESLKALAESVEFYRALAQRNPDAFQPALANSLCNLGAITSVQGQPGKALEFAREGADIAHALAERNPDAFRPKLAVSFRTQGDALSKLSRHEEALEATSKATALYRSLAQDNPEAFQPALANSLNSLGVVLSDMGRWEEALKVKSEAVELFRGLERSNPEAVRPDLAMSVNNLGVALKALGRGEEALRAKGEAVELYRWLAQRIPEAFEPNLATCLHNLGEDLLQLRRCEEALKALSEAVELRRALAARNPERCVPKLAKSFYRLSYCFIGLFNPGEALGALEEGLDTVWPHFERSPSVFQADVWLLLEFLKKLYEGFDVPPSSSLLERLATFERLTRT
ncbi:tetratricopeptide repeat protein [Corallococcus exiguus]|uniref:Tetratricopeptide repeat protein n=1 Tax=Corallococcus exiguus TaxID=83462 RepID=A0A7X4YHD6_9BACT|nr:tetratricopeptide repeat protein [Corallococcus exiguus]NBC44397.1 tetratricopeptide repeat protein [Corallococcus exiguus]TNV62155.1 tetratricopeptide repeat protein [Corallococcus exiguus]